MSIKDDLKEAKEEIQELKEQSLAMELIKDYKKQNKRQFIVILVILSMWFITIGYLVYILNNISSVETTTQEVSDIETIGGSVVNNGDDEKLTLDRINNEKDYCPENCRWSTPKFQSNHKTNNVFYTFNDKTQTSKQWCDEYGISQTTFIDRLKRGWSLEQALTISTKGKHRKVFDCRDREVENVWIVE